MKYLILAGIYNSGAEHWQTHWHIGDPRFDKLEHTSWDHPDRKIWVSELETRLQTLGSDTVLVAHSLACLMVVHWAFYTKLRIRGALLVSVPDPQGVNFPEAAMNFGEPPLKRLPFSSTVVSSDNDPYGTRDYMVRCAEAWGSKLVAVSGLGHINAESRLGAWPTGRLILEQITQ